METLVLKTELDVAQGEYQSRDQVFSPEGRFARWEFPRTSVDSPDAYLSFFKPEKEEVWKGGDYTYGIEA